MSKTICITGATSGLGKQLVLKFLKKKWKVIAIGRNGKKLKKLHRKANEGKLITYSLDLLQDNEEVLKGISKEINQIDVLINNAGYLIKKDFHEMTQQDLKDVFQVNFFALYQITQQLYCNLKKAKKAQVINIGSVGGVMNTLKFPGMSAYSSSKGAVSILTECLAKEFDQEDIVINCLSLGAMDTPMLNKAFPKTAGVNPKKIASYIYKQANQPLLLTGQNHILSLEDPN